MGEVMLEVSGPRGGLVREDVRVVEMEIVDDVGIVERLDKEELVVGGPVGTGGDDGMGGSAFANGGGEAGLDALPAGGDAGIGVRQNFAEDEIGGFGGIRGGGGGGGARGMDRGRGGARRDCTPSQR